MFRLSRWLALAAVLATGALASGCDSVAGDDTADDFFGDDKATVAQICARVMECDLHGWDSQSDCEAGWLDSAQAGTECADDDGYLACAYDCLDDECNAFAACDTDCWSENC